MRYTRSIWMIAAITLLVALVFALNLTPWVRGGYGWRWQYVPVPFVRLIPLIISLILYVEGASLILTHSRRALYALLWGLFGTVVLSLAVAYAREGDILYMLFSRTVSIVSSAEWWAGASIDWKGGEWRDWLGIMRQLGERTSNAATSPPGMPVLYGMTADVLGNFPALSIALYKSLLPYQCHNYELLAFTPAEWASAWLGMLMPLWAGLAVFPLYAITQRITQDARHPVLWWALVPGILSFTTSSSTFYPLLALVIFLFLMRGLSHRSPPPERRVTAFLLAGLIYGIGIFLNFIFLPLAALFGIYTLLHYWFIDRFNGKRWWYPVVVGLWFGIGALIPWVIFFALTGQTFFQILAQSLSAHFELDRPYWYWVWMHVWDWAVWTGFAFALVWALVLWRWMRRETIGRVPLISLTLLLTVLALTISGTTRGESGRIWLVLSPFVLMAATESRFLGATRRAMSAWFILTIGQAVFTFFLAANLEVYSVSDLRRPPSPPRVTVSQSADAVFSDANGELFRLTGWDAEASEESITLRLQWQGIERPVQYQWFSAILVSPDATTYAVDPWQPNRRYPTTCWAADMTIGDTVMLPLPENPASGNWYVSLAAFGGGSLPEGRLLVTQPDGSQDGQLGLGPIAVP